MRPVGIVATASLAGVRGPVPAIPAAEDPVPGKTRKTMARGAYLAAVALRRVLTAARWGERDGVGYFLGVGASGGSMDDLEAILRASVEDGRFDLTRFGAAGIAACNPMLAFQLMNNFTLAHGAILEGLTGPAGAYFSRGAGTVEALAEAVHAVGSGECERAIAGGADAVLHPVTLAELRRTTGLGSAIVAGEGAALVALVAGAAPVRVVAARVERDDGGDEPGFARAIASVTGVPGLVAIDGHDPLARDELADRASDQWPDARILDISEAIGATLAAGPALALVAAADQILAGHQRRAAVLTHDPDGDVGVVELAAGRPT